MQSGKPMKSMLGECHWIAHWCGPSAQGHGCPAVLWPVPGHQTRERKQPVRDFGVNSATSGRASGCLPLHPRTTAGPLASVLTRTLVAQPEDVERPGLREPPPPPPRPLPQAPGQRRAAGSGGEHCSVASSAGVETQPQAQRAGLGRRRCSVRALSPGLRGHQAVDRVGGHAGPGGGGESRSDRAWRSSSCLGSQLPVPSAAWHSAHTSMGRTGQEFLAAGAI